jgi:hypothetical protein
MKILYISQIPLSESIIKRWEMEDIANHKIEWEYLDIGSLLRNDYQRDVILHPKEKIIQNLEELKEILQNHKKCICISLVNLSTESYHLFKLLKKLRVYTAYFDWGHIPTLNDNFFKKIYSRNIIYLMKQLLFIIKKTISLRFKYDLIFQAGLTGNLNKFSKKIIPINYADIESYIDAGQGKNSEYILFLDSNICDHPDTLEAEFKINKDLYLMQVNKYFSFLEGLLKKRIIIAGHPTSKYCSNDFDGREIFYNQTAELVRDSFLVISHQSTSVAYPILYKKRIIFLGLRVMEKLKFDNPIKIMICLSKKLKTEFVYADDINKEEDINLSTQFSINNSAYDKFIHDYLSVLGPNFPRNKDIIIPTLLKVLMEKNSVTNNLYTNI